MLFLALQVANPNEMACVGFVQDPLMPSDVFVAAVQNEGISAFASQGQILYLNGPKVASLKAGDVRRVVRPEGRIRHPLTRDHLGIYHKDLGTIHIETVGLKSATARVLLSCEAILKGDLVMSAAPKTAVEFSGSLSNALTPIPEEGLVGSIVLASHDVRKIAAGHFCFISLGGRDRVKPGDRFAVFRPHPSYNPKDLSVDGKGTHASYSPTRNSFGYRYQLDIILRGRALPPRVLGDLVVVEAGDRISAAKVVNSLSEIHLGDLIVKR